MNVFPVPDGDTGTNMNLTMSSGAKEVSTTDDSNIYNVAKAFSRGLLLGARGNSGVILSQIFRGFAEGLKGKEEADAVDIAEAFMVGKEVAYKAVMKPVEGTMLTVEREAAMVLYEKAERGMPIDEAIDIFLSEAEASLKRTPNLLPVLKEVGVVDSGGQVFAKLLKDSPRHCTTKLFLPLSVKTKRNLMHQILFKPNLSIRTLDIVLNLFFNFLKILKRVANISLMNIVFVLF